MCISHINIKLKPGKTRCDLCLLRSRLTKLPKSARYEAEKALKNFKGRCESCGDVSPGVNRTAWCLDHDHVSGKFRGILCYGCNTALGYARDSVTRLNLLSEYLRRIT
ncbi:MAG: endonuclease VII domain-containing protein [Thaumarchaeota archaeon]|nr:endonuclease VII domain-containing protein [Nitrososphaerota archaeon]